MGCVRYAYFSVLIIGTPSSTFNASQGFRHGCPLSPLLFPLVVEGLSLLIANAKGKRNISGIPFTLTIVLTHHFFVDYVVFFAGDHWRSGVAIKESLTSLQLLLVCWLVLRSHPF